MLNSATSALYEGLLREVGWVHGKVELFRDLTEQFIPGSNAFYGAQPLLEVVYWLTFDSICLSISRILDPPRTGNHENASFRNFLEQVQNQLPQPALVVFESELKEAEKLAGPFRDWRNKWIGHNDLKAITSGQARPTISVDQMTVMLGHLANAMNALRVKDVDYNSGLLRGDIAILKRNLQWAKQYAQSLATNHGYAE